MFMCVFREWVGFGPGGGGGGLQIHFLCVCRCFISASSFFWVKDRVVHVQCIRKALVKDFLDMGSSWMGCVSTKKRYWAHALGGVAGF